MGKRNIKIQLQIAIIAAFIAIAMVFSCNKGKCPPHEPKAPPPPAEKTTNAPKATAAPYTQAATQTKAVTVGDIRKMAGDAGTRVIFNELEEIFTTQDDALVASLQTAWTGKARINITFNPWTATVLQMSVLPGQQGASAPLDAATMARWAGMGISQSAGTSFDLAKSIPENIDQTAGLAVMNTTTPGLVNVIPDMATAQLMFDYITHQCCALAGPYDIDYCLTFQYCEDGCYARAQKMCYILNNKYNYATHKIFSFALGSDELCVKAEKWGGCCIHWWFHVTPLVNIKTPTGTNAYVFDPAMFDQPVLLSVWLHAQENPACASSYTPHVTSISLQPTSIYCPAYFGTTTLFVTDPLYADTDSTLVNYRYLRTCP